MNNKELIGFIKPAKSYWILSYLSLAIFIAITVLLVVFGHVWISMISSFISIILLIFPIFRYWSVIKGVDNLEQSGKIKKVMHDFHSGWHLHCSDGDEIIFGNTFFFKSHSSKIRTYGDIRAMYADRLKNGRYQITMITKLRSLDYPEKLAVIDGNSFDDYRELKSVMGRIKPDVRMYDTYDSYMKTRK